MELRQLNRVVSPDKIPVVQMENGIVIKVITGHLANVKGPMDEDATNMEYLDVSLPSETLWQHRIPRDHTAFMQVLEGSVTTGNDELKTRQFGLFGPGDHVEFNSGAKGGRFLLISSRSNCPE